MTKCVKLLVSSTKFAAVDAKNMQDPLDFESDPFRILPHPESTTDTELSLPLLSIPAPFALAHASSEFGRVPQSKAFFAHKQIVGFAIR